MYLSAVGLPVLAHGRLCTRLNKQWERLHTKRCPRCATKIEKRSSDVRNNFAALRTVPFRSAAKANSAFVVTLRCAYRKQPNQTQSISCAEYVCTLRRQDCQHMRCRCGHDFCWICLRSYDAANCNSLFSHYSRLNALGCPGLQALTGSKAAPN